MRSLERSSDWPKVTELGFKAGLSDFRVMVMTTGLHDLSWVRSLVSVCSFLLWFFTHTVDGRHPQNPDV